MICLHCDKDLRDCQCPDIDERLAQLVNSPYIELTMCTRCWKYGPRCNCPPPATLVSAKRGMLN